jgi:hypothetical protein
MPVIKLVTLAFFYLYIQHVNNCGFQSWIDGEWTKSWIDGEWPKTLQNALKRLWGMYHASNCARMDEKLENAKFYSGDL